MARKVIYSMQHLRRMRNEGYPAWKSRQAVVRAYLSGRDKWRKCCFRLLQVKRDPVTRQIPDFTLECAHGRKWAIEIGITGIKRSRALKCAGFEVLKVGRGVGFDFVRRIDPGPSCPVRCPRRPKSR